MGLNRFLSHLVGYVHPENKVMMSGWHRCLDDWRRRARGRRQLARMSDRELRDIGCSQADAHREINKPFWRA